MAGEEDARAQPIASPVEPTSSTGRTEALSDGVFAIAITLLVLEIHVPSYPLGHEFHGSLLLALLAQWPVYLSYLATFLAVGTIWLNHHAFFSRLARIDGPMQWWNLLLLLGVSFTPFPNALLAEYLQHGLWTESARTAAAVYALVFALGTLPWLFLSTRLIRHPELFKAPFTADTARLERRRGIAGIAGYGLAVVIAYLAPIVGLLLFLAAAVFYAATARGLAGRTRRPLGDPR